ncbi:MAG: orotidine-5'-phosphate decarboxylase [Nitrospiraceae bacterium]|nr:orotidine-5'-phosphate decarboxylase [Nitrospiraceae bacterium]
MSVKDRIILALDVNEKDYALEIVDRFGDSVDIFKVGLELFVSAGPSVVEEIQKRGKRVFLDLKFHDIPNTMSMAGQAAARLGVFMFNVHASAGYEAMRRVSGDVTSLCLKENLPRPWILGVTVLTSIGAEELKNEFGIQHSLKTHVRHLSGLALKAGLDGVVASGQEIAMIKGHCGDKFLIAAPGIRPSWTPPDDQKRTMTPKQAIHEGADFIVLGRAVLRQPDPIKALELISLDIMTA